MSTKKGSSWVICSLTILHWLKQPLPRRRPSCTNNLSLRDCDVLDELLGMVECLLRHLPPLLLHRIQGPSDVCLLLRLLGLADCF